jgi:hypothetical protein
MLYFFIYKKIIIYNMYLTSKLKINTHDILNKKTKNKKFSQFILFDQFVFVDLEFSF